MKKIKIILTTLSKHNDAMIFANKIVENNFSPCVHLIPSMSSIYKWENKKYRFFGK